MLALQVTLTTSPGLLMISAGAGDTRRLGPAVACKTRYKTEGPLSPHSRNIQQNTHSLFSCLSFCSGMEQHSESSGVAQIKETLNT